MEKAIPKEDWKCQSLADAFVFELGSWSMVW